MKSRIAKILVVLMTTVSFLPVPAGSTESVSFDFTWWSSLNYEQKLVAVQGMMAGFEDGYMDAAATADRFVRGGSISGKIDDRMPNMGARTFGQIADTLDEVYAEHPDFAEDPVAFFVPCAASDPSRC